MDYEKFVRKHPPRNMTVEEFLRKYPPRDQMDEAKMYEILERGPRNEEEHQKLAWYFEQWVEPQDRLTPRSEIERLVELKNRVASLISSRKKKTEAPEDTTVGGPKVK